MPVKPCDMCVTITTTMLNNDFNTVLLLIMRRVEVLGRDTDGAKLRLNYLFFDCLAACNVLPTLAVVLLFFLGEVSSMTKTSGTVFLFLLGASRVCASALFSFPGCCLLLSVLIVVLPLVCEARLSTCEAARLRIDWAWLTGRKSGCVMVDLRKSLWKVVPMSQGVSKSKDCHGHTLSKRCDGCKCLSTARVRVWYLRRSTGSLLLFGSTPA